MQAQLPVVGYRHLPAPEAVVKRGADMHRRSLPNYLHGLGATCGTPGREIACWIPGINRSGMRGISAYGTCVMYYLRCVSFSHSTVLGRAISYEPRWLETMKWYDDGSDG